jgi:hypothetical protein
MVAEKSMVWRWWEHIRMISFICSSKYSSSILGAERGQACKWGSAFLHTGKGVLSLAAHRIHGDSDQDLPSYHGVTFILCLTLLNYL